jgi:hypothetical protein
VRAAAPGPLLENHSFRMHSRRCVFLVHNVLQKLSKCSRTCWIESILVEKFKFLIVLSLCLGLRGSSLMCFAE